MITTASNSWFDFNAAPRNVQERQRQAVYLATARAKNSAGSRGSQESLERKLQEGAKRAWALSLLTLEWGRGAVRAGHVSQIENGQCDSTRTLEGVWVCVCAAGRADPRCTVEQHRHRKTADSSNRGGVKASAIGLAAGAA